MTFAQVVINALKQASLFVKALERLPSQENNMLIILLSKNLFDRITDEMVHNKMAHPNDPLPNPEISIQRYEIQLHYFQT